MCESYEMLDSPKWDLILAYCHYWMTLWWLIYADQIFCIRCRSKIVQRWSDWCKQVAPAQRSRRTWQVNVQARQPPHCKLKLLSFMIIYVGTSISEISRRRKLPQLCTEKWLSKSPTIFHTLQFNGCHFFVIVWNSSQ